MKVIECRWKPGSRVGKCDANAAYKVLCEIKSKNGRIDPSDIVEAARSKKSPIHNVFEWDDAKCGAIYRRQQANNLLNSLEVKYDKKPDTFYPSFSRVNIEVIKRETPGPQRNFYIETSEAVVLPEPYECMVEEIRDFIAYLETKYANLKELRAVALAVEKSLNKPKGRSRPRARA